MIIVHHSLDPVLKSGDMKIDQQSDPQVQKPEMRKQLRLIYGMKNFFALDLNHDFAINDEIGSKSTIELHTIVEKGYRFLTLDAKPNLLDLISQAGFVG